MIIGVSETASKKLATEFKSNTTSCSSASSAQEFIISSTVSTTCPRNISSIGETITVPYHSISLAQGVITPSTISTILLRNISLMTETTTSQSSSPDEKISQDSTMSTSENHSSTSSPSATSTQTFQKPSSCGCQVLSLGHYCGSRISVPKKTNLTSLASVTRIQYTIAKHMEATLSSHRRKSCLGM